jgi:hypothetical protein
MRISRCVWHPRNFGHAKLLGVSDWRGLRIGFAERICKKCAARFRATLDRRSVRTPPPAGGARASEMAIVALGVMASLVLFARPKNDAPPPDTTASSLPRSAALARPPAPEPAVRTRRSSAPRVRTVGQMPRPSLGHDASQSP